MPLFVSTVLQDERTFHMSDVFSILRTVGIYLSIHHKDCIEMENLKNLGDNFFQLHIISVDLKSNFNLS